MVPLRIAAGDESTLRRSSEDRPRLRLVTVYDEPEPSLNGSDHVSSAPPRISRRREDATEARRAAASIQRRRSAQVRDRIWFMAASAVLIVFAIVIAFSSLQSSVSQALSGATPRSVIVGVTVKPGDTLWGYARQFGAPGAYVLDSVDAIAKQNGLDPSGKLVPGQHLRIQVENPVLLAKLQAQPQVVAASN